MIERDVRSVSNVGDLVAFQRFVELCAGRTGQCINYSILAADAGISQPTAKAWLSILEASFILYRLPAWSGNIRKRLVKMPKLVFYDPVLVYGGDHKQSRQNVAVTPWTRLAELALT